MPDSRPSPAHARASSPQATAAAAPDPITVVTLADAGFVLPLAVLVRSILDRLDPAVRLSLRVVDGGLPLQARTALAASWPAGRMDVAWLEPDYGPLARLPVSGRIPALTYARIFLPEYVASECERAIVLDADSLVLGDLTELARAPMDGLHLLAPRDAFIAGMPDRLRPLIEGAGRGRALPYFSAAAMTADVRRWRDDDVPGRAARLIAAHPTRMRTYDQDALNVVLAGSWRALDPAWQVQPRRSSLRAARDPARARTRDPFDARIVHFSGRLKPWLYRGAGEFDERFYEILDRTPFRGWRPARNLRAVGYRLYDGRLRRWLYPLEHRVHAMSARLTRRMSSVRGPRIP